jgi:fibronectin-binding autotransporter adhesin
MKNQLVLINHLQAGIKACRLTRKPVQLMAVLTTMLLATFTAWAGNTWDGGAAPDGNWSNVTNWNSDTGPAYGTLLTFGGTAGLDSTNDNATASIVGLTFASGAGAFVIEGSSVSLGGNIVNNSTNAQTINLPMVVSAANRQINPASNNIVLGGAISGSFNLIQAASGGAVILSNAGNTFNLYQINQGTTKLGVNNGLPINKGFTFAHVGVNLGTLDLNGKTQTIGAVIFAGSASTASITDTAGGGLLKLGSSVTQNANGTTNVTISAALDLNGATRTFNVIRSVGGNLTVTGPITNSTGTAGLTKSGVGTLILAGTNSYNGDTSVNAGTLRLDVASLNSNASVSVSNTAVLNLNFSETNVVLSFSIDGVVQSPGVFNATSNPGLITGAGALQVLALASLGTWDGGGSDASWSTGVNWDNDAVPVFPKALTFVGPGGLTNTNDLSGVTASSITFDSAAGAFVIGGNAITLGGNINFNADPASPITQTINVDMDLGGANRIVATQPNGNITLGGVISGNNALFKNNSGTLTLSGANTFTGDVQVRAGTLKLGANSVLPTSGLILNPISVAATVDLNGKTNTVRSLTFANSGGTEFVLDSIGGGVLQVTNFVSLNSNAGPAIISATLDLGGGSREIRVFETTSTLTVSGAIISSSGSANLVKLGSGTLILSGANTYNGDTTVDQGTLQLDLASLAATKAVYLASTNAVVLNLNFSGTNTIGVLYTNGIPLAGGIYNSSNLPGLITGSGSLQSTSVPASDPGNLVNVVVSGGSLIFSVTNSSGTYRIQSNTNLANVSGWVDIATNTAPFSFTNSTSANPQEFFRTVTP